MSEGPAKGELYKIAKFLVLAYGFVFVLMPIAMLVGLILMLQFCHTPTHEPVFANPLPSETYQTEE